MEPITIVKKRSPVWMIFVVLIVLALIVAGALWFMGDAALPQDIGLGLQVPGPSQAALAPETA